MARIKQTKTELKAQKDALSRFQRFLPMLQLKKQQLQAEITLLRTRIEALNGKITAEEKRVEPWVGLFAEAGVRVPFGLDEVLVEQGNIAGLAIPVYKGVKVHSGDIDLFETPAWIDDAAELCARLVGWKSEIRVLEKQRELIEEELRTTSQRVNLFEKVKIPECKENIRVIRIHIGDEQTSAVARGKIAKGRGKGNQSGSLEEDPAFVEVVA